MKKGVCYRCFTGNWFMEKEACIVCGAKYCYDCVLRAMGSMPEGRKCVTCIGFMIREAWRGKLGKCPRLLKRLLTDLELKRVMNAEMLCDVNQPPPELVFVNGEALRQDELFQLQNCKNPPTELRPGYYWYDKYTGFWGKKGQKPSQIITSQLKVGGNLKIYASYGNTNVLLNNKGITKEELWMLKSAGVPCEKEFQFHYWVSEDGTYHEEGQENAKGKYGTRPRFCTVFLSLKMSAKLSSFLSKEIYFDISVFFLRDENDLKKKVCLRSGKDVLSISLDLQVIQFRLTIQQSIPLGQE